MFSLDVDLIFFFFNIADFEKKKRDHEWLFLLCLFYLVHIA